MYPNFPHRLFVAISGGIFTVTPCITSGAACLTVCFPQVFNAPMGRCNGYSPGTWAERF